MRPAAMVYTGLIIVFLTPLLMLALGLAVSPRAYAGYWLGMFVIAEFLLAAGLGFLIPGSQLLLNAPSTEPVQLWDDRPRPG
jgi:MFS-type transporter involved in bile tolerance (Atg22 family)